MSTRAYYALYKIPVKMFCGKLFLVIFLHLIKVSIFIKRLYDSPWNSQQLRCVASVNNNHEKDIGTVWPKVNSVIELNHVKKHGVNDSESLENIVQNVRNFINSRKLLYDTVATVIMDRSYVIERTKMDKISAANGNIFKLFVGDTIVAKPDHIRLRLVKAKEKQNRNVRKNIYVKKLKADNIFYNKPLYYGFRQNVSNQLVFSGNSVIRSKQIYAKDVTVTQQATLASSQGESEHIRRLKLSKNTIIDSMTVELVNNINFSELYEESFLKNRDNAVNGSVKLATKESEQKTYIQDLTANILNQRRINYFFTLKTKQTIEGSLFVSKFLANNISVGSLNSMNVRTIALTGANNIFGSSIQMESLNISGDLSLALENVASFTDQVRMASKLKKFSQFYHGQVSIKGQLVLNNLLTMRNAKISMEESKMKQASILRDLSQRFWMKNREQNFSASIYFMTPVYFDTLFVTEMNDKLLNDFLLKSSNSYPAQLLTAVSLRIAGNLENDAFIEMKQGLIRIERLSSNLVYRNLQFNAILGRKVFDLPLKIWHLTTRRILSNDVSRLVYTYFPEHSIQFMNADNISEINVAKFFTINTLIDVRMYNAKSLPKFFQLAGTIDQKLIASQGLRFTKRMGASNMQINYMNQLSLPRSNYSAHENFNLARELIIKSNVLFLKNLQITTLNRIDWKEYFAVLTLNGMDTRNVGGNKIFLKPVLVSSALNVNELNNYESEKIYKAALKNLGTQTVIATCDFESLSTKVLETKSTIAGIDVHLLMRSDANINIAGSLMVRAIKLRGSLFGISATTSMAYDLFSRLRQVEEATWTSIDIRHKAHWPSFDVMNALDYDGLVNFAIRRESEQEIVAKVQFKSVPRFLFSSSPGVEISYIVTDSLARNQNYLNATTLRGSKYFEAPIEISGSAHFKHNLNTGFINGIDILYLNETFYRKNIGGYQKLYSRKRISPSVRIGNLIVSGFVNSVDMIKVMFIGLEQNGIPYVKFTKSRLSMKALEISHLNTIHFPAFIEGRARISGEKQIINGSLTFDSVRIKKAVLTKINGFTIDRFLFKELKKHQIIHSNKAFMKPLLVIGPSSMLNVNGIELIQKFETTLRLNQHLKFNTVRIFENGYVAFHYGLNILGHSHFVAMDKVNNISHLKEQLHRIKAQSIYEFPLKQRSRFLYLDFSNFSSAGINNTDVSEVVEFSEICASSSSYVNKANIVVPLILRSENLSLKKPHSYAKHLKLIVGNNCSILNSKLEIEINKTQQFFNFSNAIESIQLFDSMHQDFIYMIINFLSKESVKSIHMYRIDQHNGNVTYIQEISRSESSNSTAVFQFGISRQWMLLFSADKIIVYAFNPYLEQFYEASSHELRYNQVAYLPDGIKNDSYQMIVANNGDRYVSVQTGNNGYKFQEIYLPEPLKAFATFYVTNSGEMIMIILMEDGNFYLFKYLSNVEGWVYETAGVISGANLFL